MARRTTSSDEPRDRIVDAALALAGEMPWDRVRLGDIAERAGVDLVTLRALFADKGAILAAFSERIDRAVLSSLDPEMSDEPARERLFDVMMARLDALAPYREAVGSIMRAYGRDPVALLAWNAGAQRSMTWMLEAAGIGSSGRLGALRAQGLAVAFARTLRVWLDDDDPGLARTMATLDRRLRDGESCLRRLDTLCAVAGGVSRILRGSGSRRRREGEPRPEGQGA